MRCNLFTLTALASATFLAMPMAAAQAPTTAALDGKVFVADAGEKGKAADEKNDVITFDGGKLHSSACDQYGFDKGDYKAARSGDAVTFDAETRSEKDGRLVWRGTVRGDEIEGTFVHYRKGWMLNPNPEPVEHWFKGRVKS
jgi:hypothetical protein